MAFLLHRKHNGRVVSVILMACVLLSACSSTPRKTDAKTASSAAASSAEASSLSSAASSAAASSSASSVVSQADFESTLGAVEPVNPKYLEIADFTQSTGSVKLNFQKTGGKVTVYEKTGADGNTAAYMPVSDFCALMKYKYTQKGDQAVITGNGFFGGVTAGSNKVVVNNRIVATTNTAGYLNGKLMADMTALTAASNIRVSFSDITGVLYLSNQQSSAKTGTYNGRQVIYVNGKPQAPTIYCGTEGSEYTWLPKAASSISSFVGAGVDIIQNDMWFKYFWRQDGTLDMTTACNQIAGILDKNPGSYVMLRFNISPPVWWTDDAANASELIGYTGAQGFPSTDDAGASKRTSLASQKYLAAATAKLAQFLTALKNTPEGDRVIGVQITGGNYGEFQYYGFSYEPDSGKAMTAAFQTYLQNKYGTVAKLNAAWKTKLKSFSKAGVPSYNARYASANGLRDPSVSQSVLDYYDCQGKVVSSMVIRFAKTIKQAWGRPLMCGVFYGYLFCQDNGGDYTVSAGASQIDVKSIFASPYIDEISGPFAARDLTLSGGFRSLAMSATLNGKLFITENDMPTYLGDGTKAVFPRGCRDLRDSIAMMRRNYMYTLTENAGLWYYDFGPDNLSGEFNTPQLMKEVKSLKALSDQSVSKKYTDPADVLVVYDIYSYDYTLPITSDQLAYNLVDKLTLAMQRTGVSFDQIFLSDLSKVNLSQYKAVIFANTMGLSSGDVSFIKSKVMTPGRTVMYVSADGYYRVGSGAATQSLNNISDLTGIEVGIQEKGSNMALTGLLSGTIPEMYFASYFKVTDESAAREATYADGNVAGALKNENGCKVWYFGAPMTDAANLRSILTDAGCHVYVSGSDSNYITVGGGYIGIYSFSGGEVTVTLQNGKQETLDIPSVNTVILDASTGKMLTSYVYR